MTRIVELLVDSEPGSRLPTERELAERLHVGRSTIREALRALISLGAVQARRGEGMFVGNIDETYLKKLVQLGLVLRRTTWKDVIEVRHMLESQVVMIASVQWTEADMAKLQSISSELARYVGVPAADSPTASELDLAFHQALTEATHNEMLKFLVQSIRGLLGVWVKRGFASGNLHIADIVEEHEAIVQAMLERDPGKAARLMGEHIEKSSVRLLGKEDREQLIAQSLVLHDV